MSAAITIAMPRMVPNQLLAEAHAKYPESLGPGRGRDALDRAGRPRKGRAGCAGL